MRIRIATVCLVLLTLLTACGKDTTTYQTRKYEEDGITYEYTSQMLEEKTPEVKKGVVTIYMQLSSGSIRPKVTDIVYTEDKKSVKVVLTDANRSRIETDDMAFWTIKVPVDIRAKSATYVWKK